MQNETTACSLKQKEVLPLFDESSLDPSSCHTVMRDQLMNIN